MKQRERIWDFIKGIGIVIVLFGHSVGVWNYETWDYYVPVNSFNFNSWFIIRCLICCVIGVFFFVSGYMISEKNENPLGYYEKRIKRIVIPYLIWSGIYTLVNMLFYKQNVTFTSFILGTNGIQLYFLVVSIQLMLLTPLMTAIKNKKLMLFICMSITLINNIWQLSYWLKNESLVTNEMILCTCFIGYYYLGYFIKTAVDATALATHKGRIFTSSLMATSFLIILADSYWRLNRFSDATISMSFNSPANILYTVSVILFIISFKDLYRSNKLSEKIEWIGYNSIDFFAVHWLVMYPMKLWYLKNIPSEYMWLSNISLMVVTFIPCMVFVLAKQRILASILDYKVR